MRGRKGYIFSFLLLALAVLAWLMIHVRQRQEAQARLAYYATVLAQAPCMENVCPGFDAGRARALERLAHSEFVQSNEQGTDRIGLLFTRGEDKSVGSGVINFATGIHGTPTIVHHISFRLYDLMLASVFDMLGDPDQFLFISGCGMGRRVHAELFYLSQGIEIIVDYTTRQPESQVLEGNTPVQAVIYLQPSDFQNRISEWSKDFVTRTVEYDFHLSVMADDIIAQIRPWPGINASPTPSADFCPR